MQDRVADYLNFGVRYVWVIDPRTRKAWRCTMGAISEVNELRTEDSEIVVPLDALFDND
jgi:Uma2 family endonuclease